MFDLDDQVFKCFSDFEGDLKYCAIIFIIAFCWVPLPRMRFKGCAIKLIDALRIQDITAILFLNDVLRIYTTKKICELCSPSLQFMDTNAQNFILSACHKDATRRPDCLFHSEAVLCGRRKTGHELLPPFQIAFSFNLSCKFKSMCTSTKKDR